MDIHHIRYFLAVCETRNFTRAAEKCNVTQPALSRAIQQLEDEVGGLLFRRERNLTHITDLGALLQAALPAGPRRAESGVRRKPRASCASTTPISKSASCARSARAASPAC